MQLVKMQKENNELVISYSFPPSVSAAGNAMAKKILKNNQKVDVIYCNPNSGKRDDDFSNAVNKYITKRYEIDIPFSTEWENIKRFTREGMNALSSKSYNKIYSMCYFQHSHFLALEYKLTHPDTLWYAEFSDPLTAGINGKDNTFPISDGQYIEQVNKIIPENYPKITSKDTLNFICEYLTYLFADTIIFTNENQRKVMIDNFAYDELKEEIYNKSSICEHVTIDKEYYNIIKSNYEVDSEKVNFAYFGAIYGKRTLENYVNGFDLLNDNFKDKYHLHIFTEQITHFEQLLSQNVIENTTLNPEINYLEFLNLCNKFDVLLVNDTITKEVYSINPFLPSKLSDYEGSNTDIWAICEKNSTMDNKQIKYKSRANDIPSIKNTLNKIMEDKLSLKHQPINKTYERLFDSKYYTDLSKLEKNEDLKVILDDENNTTEYLENRILELSVKIDELIQVAQEEFRKDSHYENEINKLNEYINQIKKENETIKNSNSWKITKPLRHITNKLK